MKKTKNKLLYPIKANSLSKAKGRPLQYIAKTQSLTNGKPLQVKVKTQSLTDGKPLEINVQTESLTDRKPLIVKCKHVKLNEEGDKTKFAKAESMDYKEYLYNEGKRELLRIKEKYAAIKEFKKVFSEIGKIK